jgi:predicted Zn finger-like uncharacterized protein
MIAFSCPGCQATFKLADEMAGKSARCSKCNHRFTVPAAKPKAAPVSAPAPVAAPRAMPAAAPRAMSPKRPPMPEVMEAEIVDEPAPPRRAKPPEIMEAVEVVDEGIEEPRRGRPSAPPRARDDYDDEPDRRRDRRRDEDDWDDDGRDRPRRAKKGGSLGMIMACVGGGSFVLMFVMIILMVVTAPTPGFVINNAAGGGVQIKFDPKDFQMPNFNPNDFKMPNIPKGNPVGKAPAPANAATVLDKQDQLTPQDPFDTMRVASRAKRYTVQLDAGKTYTIDMMAVNPPGFDSYLRLEHNGVTVAQDDDGGDGLNARIVFQPMQAGQYVVVATTFQPQMGSYRLTVRSNP